MVSRITFVLVLLTSCQWAFGQNFITHQTGDPERSRAIVDRAEQCRAAIAEAWFGERLTNWDRPCVVIWQVTSGRGSGMTTYDSAGQKPRSMRMQVDGDWDRIINDVVPHETLHLVLRDHLGFSVPRWMDEGAASTAESDDSISHHEMMLRQYLSQGRVPPINMMMTAREYPSDVMPFYSQGVSVSRFLVGKRGANAFVDLARSQRQSGSWTSAFQQVYGYRSLGEMQTDWMEWVQAGCPDFPRDATTSLKPIPRSQAPYRPIADIVPDQQLCAANGQCQGVPSCADCQTVAPQMPPATGSPERVIRVEIEYAKLADELVKRPEIHGKDGVDGKDGADGRGIESIQRKADDTLEITYTDKTSVNVGKIPQGPVGVVSDDYVKKLLDRLQASPSQMTAEQVNSMTVQVGTKMVQDKDFIMQLVKALQDVGLCNTLEKPPVDAGNASRPQIYWDLE